jgi:uncharacterized protein with FMN-binding domain
VRRAVPTLIATLAGLGLLAEFHTSPTSVAAGAPPSSQSVIAGPPATTTPKGPVPGRSGTTTTTAPPLPPGTKTVDGPVAQTRYGDVEVRVVIANGKITDVVAVTLPSDRSRSARISQQAEPILRQEALQAQSAHIDIVSGATFTTEGYAQSLQGALDLASK